MMAADRTPTRLAVDFGNERAEVELASGIVLVDLSERIEAGTLGLSCVGGSPR
jgi:hypothetical protein